MFPPEGSEKGLPQTTPAAIVPPPSQVDHYLRDFFDQVYAPTMLRGRSDRFRRYFPEMLERLTDALCRQPRLSDLSWKTLELFARRLAGAKLSPTRTSKLLQPFRGLWKLAADLGRCELPPRPKMKECSRGNKLVIRPAGIPRTGPPRKPPLLGGPGTLVDFFNTTYVPQAIFQASENYHRSMRRLLRRLRDCFGRDLQLSELSAPVVAHFTCWMRDEGLQMQTIKNERTRLLCLWRFAADLGEAAEPCRVRKIRVPCEPPDAWSLEEVGKIIAAAKTTTLPAVRGIPGTKYWPALLLVAWYTGLRRGSLLAIRSEHVDLEGRWLDIPAGVMKNFVGKRYRLGEDAVQAIAEIWDPSRELLFPVCDVKKVWRGFKAVLAAAAVRPSRHTLNHFHKMRRSTATAVAVAAGLAAASALLGHSSEHLLKRYIDPSFTVSADATAWLPELGPCDEVLPPVAVCSGESPRRRARRQQPALQGEPGTIVDFYNSTYLPEALFQASDSHRKALVGTLHKMRECFGRDLLLTELSGQVLGRFVAWLRQKGLAITTVKNNRARLLCLWRFAADVGLAAEPKRVPRIRIPREQPDAWSLDEVRRIMTAARQPGRPPVRDIPAANYWPALLLVAWYTGLRRRSLHSIRPGNLDLNGRWLDVPAGAMKNFVGKRYRLGEDAITAIKKIWDPDRELLFPKDHLGFSAFGEIVRVAGVRPSRLQNGKFHKMRRSTATAVAVAAGLAAASALLGHSSGDLLKRYIDPSFTVSADATDWLAPPVAIR